MIKLGLIGKNIAHSLSQNVYEELLGKKIIYKLMDIDQTSKLPLLEELFNDLDGLSITSPYKQHYLGVVNNGSDFTAINCIKKTDHGFLANNTDAIAVSKQLVRYNQKYRNVFYYVLGSGVMADLIIKELKIREIPFINLSRKNDANFFTRKYNPNKETQKTILINCCARDFEFKNQIDPAIVFWDLNYNHTYHENYLSSKVENYLDGKIFLKDQAKAALDFWSIK